MYLYFRSVLVLSLFFLLNQHLLPAQSILIDENFSDWDSVPSYSEEMSGDADGGAIDILDLKVSSDSEYIYFYISTDQEFLLQDNPGLTILIDSDNNPNTGQSFADIGYDLRYNLGGRSGEILGTASEEINSYDIGLVSAPTVSSDTFEFKIDRNIMSGGNELFASQTIKFAFRTQSSNGDLAPDNPIDLNYILSDEQYQSGPISLDKLNPEDIRVLSYNVLRDNLFDTNVQAPFERIFKAIDPDIIGLQEVYNNSGAEAANLIETFLPSENGESWHHGDVGNDNLIVSRFPVIDQKAVSGNAAYLLDLSSTKLLVVVAHPPCCTNDEGRQEEFDAIMSFIRDSQSGLEFNLAKDTPILIIGDMNLVGLNRQVETLLSGDIADEGRFGPDFNPDWDGTSFEDTRPENPGSPTTFTWYNQNSSFSAGRLDYIVYSGSVWEIQNSFSLFTPALSDDMLTENGLQKDDTIVASDHLPLVADFRPKMSTSILSPSETPSDIKLHQNFPNPFNPTTTIRYSLPNRGMVTLEVFGMTGRKIANLVQEVQPAGEHAVTWEAGNEASGLYFIRLSANKKTVTGKMMLLK
ncbi:MAG: endonuclease/exonuclease/phosphatase family protein [Gracilimonas sp.]|nr:endonuclease/exonuclease/phosphatase family protein [Gracilimonas sp.]